MGADFDPMLGNVLDAPLARTMSERYLAYAMSTIVSRSLPDLRDGLKPVHRRILYAMAQLKLSPGTAHKKCARVVGDVIGKYHPHGDIAVYDALVRMAQDFAQRYPLVDGQGNFGNVDGDTAAAMRYTESRLTKVADLLLGDLDRDTVDFRATYDNSDREPVVLPGAFPNLLANGAVGIAVGMATSIPPHNILELCDAATVLIEDPDCPLERLLEHVHGPDFPTGCDIPETPATLREIYETGRGPLRQRAKWHKEDGRSGTWTVVITEIPYQVEKSKLIENIARLINEKKLPLVADIRDESDERIRIVIEPRSRSVDPDLLMAGLYRSTDLESRFNFNMNVLDSNLRPGVMGLRGLLRGWLDHRHEVLLRRSRHRLAQIARRIEILDGQILIYLNLDEVIRIIRDADDAKADLRARFGLTDLQAESVLEMRLRALRRLDEIAIKAERDKLADEGAGLEALLADAALQWQAIGKEIAALKASYVDQPIAARRSRLVDAVPIPVASAEVFVEREPLTVILSEKGWIRARAGHAIDESDLKFKDGDGPGATLRCQSTDRITLVADQGRIYTLAAADLPRGRGDGTAIRVLFDTIGPEDEIITMTVADPGRKYLFTATTGKGFVFDGGSMTAEKRSGKVVMAVSGAEKVLGCEPVKTGMSHLLCRSSGGKMVIFPLEEIVEMGRGAGVGLQKLGAGETLIEARQVDPTKEILPPTDKPKAKPIKEVSTWMAHRATKGRLVPKGW